VLILAGSKAYQNLTLLAAGFTPGDYTSKDNYITAGINNVISITLKSIPLEWNSATKAGAPSSLADITTDGKNDFGFTAKTAAAGSDIVVAVENRYVHISPLTLPDADSSDPNPPIVNTAVFNVKFYVGKFATTLLLAEKGSNAGAITFAERRVKIEPLGNELKYFAPIKLGVAASDTPSGPELKAGSTSNTNTFIAASGVTLANTYINFFNKPDTTGTDPKDVLPANNKDGKLIFELDYYAFGTDKSGGSLWTIRNGLNDDEDYASLDSTDLTGDTDGGAIHLVFGAGDPTEVDSEGVIIRKAPLYQ
jgi:hypothetical protein